MSKSLKDAVKAEMIEPTFTVDVRRLDWTAIQQYCEAHGAPTTLHFAHDDNGELRGVWGDIDPDKKHVLLDALQVISADGELHFHSPTQERLGWEEFDGSLEQYLELSRACPEGVA